MSVSNKTIREFEEAAGMSRVAQLLRLCWPPRTGPDGTLVGSVDIFANGLVFEDPPKLELNPDLEAAIKTAASGPLHTLVWAPIPTAEEMVLGAAAGACAYIDTDGLVLRGDLREGSLRSWGRSVQEPRCARGQLPAGGPPAALAGSDRSVRGARGPCRLRGEAQAGVGVRAGSVPD
jgi:hypothetical protein